MRNKVQTKVRELSPAAKARILKELEHGDQANIARLVGTVPEYVKQVMRYRTEAKSALAHRIWFTADRILRDRRRLKSDLGL
jgi:hypothetical protein